MPQHPHELHELMRMSLPLPLLPQFCTHATGSVLRHSAALRPHCIAVSAGWGGTLECTLEGTPGGTRLVGRADGDRTEQDVFGPRAACERVQLGRLAGSALALAFPCGTHLVGLRTGPRGRHPLGRGQADRHACHAACARAGT